MFALPHSLADCCRRRVHALTGRVCLEASFHGVSHLYAFDSAADTGSGPDAASSCMSGTGLQAQWRYLFSEADSASEPATPRSNGCPPGHSHEQRGLPTDSSGPLPGSQSHIDLESFAASILLEDHTGHHIDQPLSMDLTGNDGLLLGLEEHSDSVAVGPMHMQQAPQQQQHFQPYGDWALHQTAMICGSPRTVQSSACQQGAELAYMCRTAAPGGAPTAASESFNAFLLDTGDFESGSPGLSNLPQDSARTQLSRTVSLPPNANRHPGHLSFHYSEPCSPGACSLLSSSQQNMEEQGHTIMQ